MKVLILHDRYHEVEPGGETNVVRRECALLEAAGVTVRLLEWPPAAVDASMLGKALVHALASYSLLAHRRVAAAIAAFRPNLVHVHNFWPRLTPSAHYTARRAGLPVVQTLHNYRLLCAADLLLRDGQPCTLCVERALPWPALRHRCERHSLARSALKASAFALHQVLGTWHRAVDVFIAWSPSMRAQFIRGGLPADRIVVTPQFAPDAGTGPEQRDYFFFAGRLSSEKGIELLLSVWQRCPDLRLHIAGGGVYAGAVRAAAACGANIRYLGTLSEEAVRQAMRGAIATLVPSLWEEPFPLVIAESYAAGTPVLAADTGSRGETVGHGTTGLHFPAGDAGALEQSVRWIAAHPAAARAMGVAARRRYEREHSAAVSQARLLAVYDRARAARDRRAAGEDPDGIQAPADAVR